jgi:hypothetical protein
MFLDRTPSAFDLLFLLHGVPQSPLAGESKSVMLLNASSLNWLSGAGIWGDVEVDRSRTAHSEDLGEVEERIAVGVEDGIKDVAVVEDIDFFGIVIDITDRGMDETSVVAGAMDAERILEYLDDEESWHKRVVDFSLSECTA